MTTNHAAIDIGTNSFHLLVAEVDEGGAFSVLTTEKESVRLGEGPGEIRELSVAAMDRGIAALGRFRAIADSFGAGIDAVATSAVREAANGADFVTRAWTDAGIDIDVISGPEEARLIHLGVLQALPVFDRQVLVVDIGGGSTELVVGRAGKMLAARSVKLGHLRLTNRFIPGGRVEPGTLEYLRQYVASYLVPVTNALAPLGYQVAIGSSGTANAIGELLRIDRDGHAGSPGLDNPIDRVGLKRLVDQLAGYETAAERLKAHPGLKATRADVIVAGAILLDELFEAFGIETMLTSPYALREGVLLDRTHGLEAGASRLADLRRDSLMSMADAFEEDLGHIQHATYLALALFDALADLHGLGPAERELLEAAGLLHNVGLFVSHAAHHLHSEYIISNSDRLFGYTEREIAVIAQVARYHRKSAPKPSHAGYTALAERDRERVDWLSAILRIAIALDRTRSGAVTAVQVRVGADEIAIECHGPADADRSVEVFAANSRAEMLVSAAERTVTVV